MYEVFEHLLRMWMGTWLHNHTNIAIDASPDLWKLAEILSYASVQTMPLCFGWGCRTFQTASHVHVIAIWGVWLPSQGVHGHMASHSHHCHHGHFPRFVKWSLYPTWCKCANHATTLLVEAVEPFKLHPMSMAYLYEVLEYLLRMWMGIWLHTHIINTTDAAPDLWELAEIILMQVWKPCHYALIEAVEPFKLHPMSMAYL